MSILFAESTSSTLLWVVLKASTLLAFIAILQLALRTRASAATRHLVWTLGLAGLLVLPLASVALPEWSIAVRPASAGVPAEPMTTAAADTVLTGEPASAVASDDAPPDAPRPAAVSWSSVVAVIYAAGAAGMLLYLMLQQWRVRRFAYRATRVHDVEWTTLLDECAGRLRLRRPVRLLRSREHNVPMTFGTRAPAIVVPAVADTWTEGRRSAVLLHELAHVARFDCLTQLMASAACAMYWFHPAAWWVARRLRVERELACDDRVIAAGTEPRDYAGHLLEIAYSLGGHRAPAMAVTMARRTQLEGRLLAALDGARNRRVPAWRVRVATVAAAAVVLAFVAGVRLTVAADETRNGPAFRGASQAATSQQGGQTFDPRRMTRRLVGMARQSLHALRNGTRSVAHAFRSTTRATAGVVRQTTRATADNVRGVARTRASAPAQDGRSGTWEIRPGNTDGTVNLRLLERDSSWGSSVAIDRLEGLTRAHLTGAGGQIVQFRLRRDAGTFSFEGVLRNGVGAGTFAFAPDPNFAAELAKRGFARPTAEEQYDLARADVGFAFLDELTAQGYSKPQTSDIVKAAHHGVRLEYVRDMGALGYRLGSLAPLITLRDHGVTPDYVRQLAANGYKGLSADELRRARDHGVGPEYVQAMREAGYGSLSMDALINARDHGVSAEYVRGMRDAGYGSLTLDTLIKARDHGVSVEYVRQLADLGHRKLPLDEMIRLRDHGVSSEYVREMRQLGFALSLDELVRARDHGVGVEFVREMAALGYTGQTMDGLIRLRDHGVSPQYARDLKALGYDKLALDDMITLRDHGLTAERIKSANARAGTRLPIDLLKSLASGGWR